MNAKIASLKALFEEHSDALFRYAFFKLDGDRETALDFVQEAFYKMGKSLDSGKEIENPRAYLYRIISNLIMDQSRGNQPLSLEEYIDTTGQEPSYEESQNDKLDAKLEVERVYEILETLGQEDKEVFILRYVEELSPSEIAEIYAKPINTITVRLHRLKQKITAQLTPKL